MSQHCTHRLSGSISLALLVILCGCAPYGSKVDSSRSYFDGGALQAPNPSTVVMTGRVLRSQGRISEAEYVLRRVVSEHPEYAPGYSELAELLLKDGRSGETIILLESGTVLIPTSAMLHNDLGMCYVVTRRFDKALHEFLVASQFAPEDATYAANYAMVLGLQGHYEESLESYSLVIPMEDAIANVSRLAEARGDSDWSPVGRERIKK
jgi:tetratricopeptide (TPR) repeat protein